MTLKLLEDWLVIPARRNIVIRGWESAHNGARRFSALALVGKHCIFSSDGRHETPPPDKRSINEAIQSLVTEMSKTEKSEADQEVLLAVDRWLDTYDPDDPNGPQAHAHAHNGLVYAARRRREAGGSDEK